jgi:hypothetical protein
MKRQEEFYDIPTSTMTPLQIRAKLAEVASAAGLTSDQVASFSDALTLKSSPNGGVSVTDELKYTSESPPYTHVFKGSHRPQSSSLGRTAFMFRPPSSGMASLPTKFRAHGAPTSGQSSSPPR